MKGLLADVIRVDEPTWRQWKKSDDSPTSYTRPLLGSENLFWKISSPAGATEQCAGLTFKTPFTVAAFEIRLLEALGRLRFLAPLIAATITVGLDGPDTASWVYTPALSHTEVESWARNHLHVFDFDTGMTATEFAANINQTRLPHIASDGVPRYFHCYILPHHPGEYSFFIHASHILFDARTFMMVSHFVHQQLVNPQEGLSVRSLPWGSEWKSLPPGILTATGAGPVAAEEALNERQLLELMSSALTDPIPSHMLEPPKYKVEILGRPQTIRSSISVKDSRKIEAHLKAIGYSLTHLSEAALVLATFEQNPNVIKPEDKAYVLCDPAFVALNKYLIPPHNRQSFVGSIMSVAPHKVPYSLLLNFKNDTSESKNYNQLLAVLKNIHASYKQYLSNPSLPRVFSRFATACAMSSRDVENFAADDYRTTLIHAGNIDLALPIKYFIKKTQNISQSEFWQKGGVDLTEVAGLERIAVTFSGRSASFHRPCIHTWISLGQIEVQVQFSFAWNRRYMSEFLEKFVKVLIILAERPIPTAAELVQAGSVQSRL